MKVPPGRGELYTCYTRSGSFISRCAWHADCRRTRVRARVKDAKNGEPLRASSDFALIERYTCACTCTCALNMHMCMHMCMCMCMCMFMYGLRDTHTPLKYAVRSTVSAARTLAPCVDGRSTPWPRARTPKLEGVRCPTCDYKSTALYGCFKRGLYFTLPRSSS